MCEEGERGMVRTGWEGQGGGVGRAKVGGSESVWEQYKRGKNEEGEVEVGGEGRIR